MAAMAAAWGPVCMTMIGLGYLFPIAAIWAAFDYWKELFPTTNVEFTVTCVYQVGSVVTVMALSFTKGPFSLAPRIRMGMAGQFLCLGVIMCFRWIGLDADLLYWALLALVLAVSIATGFLDSALLALCAQYESKMQSWLQLGIGMGTLVSVIYRDVTKLLMPGNVKDGTTAYFAVAVATIAACYFCYRLLMTLPVSQHVVASDRLATQAGAREPFRNGAEGTTASAPTGTPLLGAHFTPVRMPLSELTDGDAEAGKQDATIAMDAGAEPGAVRLTTPDQDSQFGPVWSKVWKNQVTVFLNLFLTTLCYPGIITAIPCREWFFLKDGEWFQTLLLTAFTFADMFGRLLTGRRFGLSYQNIWLTAVVRAAIFPVMLFCATLPWSNDVLSFVVVAMFGFLNGYCVSLSLIVVNEVPGMSNEQRKTCGRISACAVNGGLCLGSCGAAALATMFHL